MIYQEMVDFGYRAYKEYLSKINEGNGVKKIEGYLNYNEGLLEIIKEKEALELMIKEIPNCESEYIADFRRAVNEYFKYAKGAKKDLTRLPLGKVIDALLGYFNGIREFIKMETELRNRTCEPKTLAETFKQEMSENPAELY